MVGRILRRHRIVERQDGVYSLVGYHELGREQLERLIEMCEAELD